MTSFGCPERLTINGNVFPLFRTFKITLSRLMRFSSRHLVSKLPCRFSCRTFQTSTWRTYGCAVRKDSLMIDAGSLPRLVLFNEIIITTSSCLHLGLFCSTKTRFKVSDVCLSSLCETGAFLQKYTSLFAWSFEIVTSSHG